MAIPDIIIIIIIIIITACRCDQLAQQHMSILIAYFNINGHRFKIQNKCIKTCQNYPNTSEIIHITRQKHFTTRMWANAQRDGRPVEHRWCPLFNAAVC